MYKIRITSLELSTDMSEGDPFEQFCLSVLSPLNNNLAARGENSLELPAKRVRSAQTTSCSCKKSKCLKLYCECFTTNSFCGPNCTCRGCQNKPRRINLRNKAVAKVLKKNSFAFLRNGCNCVKSECQKNYCECFHSGLKCLDTCKCIGCKNKPDVYI